MTGNADIYLEIAGHLPNRVALGGALITMVEPDVGFEQQYNRWYEDDHFYAGAMVGPWMFAGRRWVATRDLRSLRFPADSSVIQPLTVGCYISTYFVLDGHLGDHWRWSRSAMADHLQPVGRGFEHVHQVYTAFSTYEFGVIRKGEHALLPHHMLDHPFRGMTIEIVAPAPGTSRPDLLRRLRDETIPTAIEGSPVAATLAFTLGPGVASPGAGVNVTLLSFLQTDPRSCWSRFRQHEALYDAAGGQLVFAAPFVPTVPGTDTYVNELR